MKLSFHGGVGEVTGACYLLDDGKTKILIDCGLFQGCEECGDWNFSDFQFDPASIDALFVTHAHLDHVGRIPKLVKKGFKGVIYSTPPTKDIAALILEDALSIAERNGEALYDAADLERAESLWRTIAYGTAVSVGSMAVTLRNAGHILGSSMVEIAVGDATVLFTGDLGNVPSALVPPPEDIRGVTHLVIESAYGNRSHEAVEEREHLIERAVEDASTRKGTLVIPAFATERTQDLLYLFNTMMEFHRIPAMPVFVDAPLAIRVTKVFEQYRAYYKDEIQALFAEHPSLFQFKHLKFTPEVAESKAINDVPPPKIVIAGSGMMNGGRILHHLKRYLPEKTSILLVVGYQAAGSMGRRLIDGAREVKILGEEVAVASEIRKINGLSAHADNPQLFAFVAKNRDTLKRVFVVQGERAAALHLSQEIKDRLGIAANTPELYDAVDL